MEAAAAAALPAPEEEVVVVAVESPPPPPPPPWPCSPGSKFEDIFRLLSDGCFPPGFCSIKRKNLKRYAQKFVVEGGCLYYVGPKKEEKREVVVDPERRQQVFLKSHFTEFGNHLGQKKTVHRIQSRYYWLGIVRDVVEWIKMCETCQNTEHSKSLLKKPRPIKVESPWEILGLDVYGPFPESSQGNVYVLAVMDQYTKWVEAIPLQKRDTLSVARVLASLFYRFGASKNIFCTLNWDFCEEVIKLLLERWNISQLLTPADPATRAILDIHTNELLKSSICRLVNEKPSEWDESLDSVLFGYRTSVNSVTKYTPFFLLYNRYSCLSSETAYAKDPSREHRTTPAPYKTNGLPSFSDAVQEQQKAVKEIVMANMAAAYKQEQRTLKRKMKDLSPLTYKMEDSTLGSCDDQTLKRVKKSQFVSFQIETVLPQEQSISSMKKTG